MDHGLAFRRCASVRNPLACPSVIRKFGFGFRLVLFLYHLTTIYVWEYIYVPYTLLEYAQR